MGVFGSCMPERYKADPFVSSLRLDGEWIWVVLDQHKGPSQFDQICGYLIAYPCHNIVHVLRVYLDADAPNYSLVPLFRKFFHDCRERGFKGLFSYFDMQSDAENRLSIIMHKVGGVVLHRAVIMVVSPLPKEGL